MYLAAATPAYRFFSSFPDLCWYSLRRTWARREQSMISLCVELRASIRFTAWPGCSLGRVCCSPNCAVALFSYYFLTRNAFFGLSSLLLVQQWLPGVAQHWNWPSWSLSVEAFFYATFPLLFAASRRWRVPTLVAVLALMLVLVAVQTAIAQGGNHPLLTGTVLATSWEDFALGLPISQLPLFVSGIVLARLYQQGVVVRIRGGWIVAGLLVLSAFMCGARTMVAGLPRDAWLPPLFVLLIAALATTRLADKGLVARSCMLLGWASYSLYPPESALETVLACARQGRRRGVFSEGSAAIRGVADWCFRGCVLVFRAADREMDQGALWRWPTKEA